MARERESDKKMLNLREAISINFECDVVGDILDDGCSVNFKFVSQKKKIIIKNKIFK